LIKEGLTFSGRFAEAAALEYERFATDLESLEFLLIMRDKVTQVDVSGKRRITSIRRRVSDWLHKLFPQLEREM
jgi:hypothetical protein